MRDPNRIHEVMKQIEELWQMYPDWRFMQLMCNIQSSSGSDMYYCEDSQLEAVIASIRKNGF